MLGASHYPPTYVGGVEVLTEKTAHWLASRGHSVEVVCVETIEAERFTVRAEHRDGVTIHRLGLKLAGTGEHLGLRYRDDVVGEWLGDLFVRSRADIFHSENCYLLTASTLDAAIQAGLATVVTLHDYWFFCPRITLLRSNGERCSGMASVADCTWCLMGERRRYKLLEFAAAKTGNPRRQGVSETGPMRWPLDPKLRAKVADRRDYIDAILRAVDRILILAPLARELLLARGFSSERVQLITSGLDVRGWKGLPRMPAQGAFRIGYLGQVVPHKGVHLLVEAFRRMSKTGRPVELHIHGDDSRSFEYGDTLRRLSASDPRIRFAGRYENHDVEGILSRLDVIVVPSTWFEVRPLVIMEAFAAKVPVIASRLPNMQYQVRDEVDGLLFAPGDVNDLTRTLQRLADDPDLERRLISNIGPIRTVDEEMSEIEGIYKNLRPRSTVRPPERVVAMEGVRA